MKYTLFIIICLAEALFCTETAAQVPAWGLAARPKPVEKKIPSDEQVGNLFQSAGKVLPKAQASAEDAKDKTPDTPDAKTKKVVNNLEPAVLNHLAKQSQNS